MRPGTRVLLWIAAASLAAPTARADLIGGTGADAMAAILPAAGDEVGSAGRWAAALLGTSGLGDPITTGTAAIWAEPDGDGSDEGGHLPQVHNGPLDALVPAEPAASASTAPPESAGALAQATGTPPPTDHLPALHGQGDPLASSLWLMRDVAPLASTTPGAAGLSMRSQGD